jgi:hypothetical protein
LDSIIRKESLKEMPSEMKEICFFIAQSGERYKMNFVETILPLISGYLMLRFICPGITVPNVYGGKNIFKKSC